MTRPCRESRDPTLLHTLGLVLVLVRERRTREALEWLGAAAHSSSSSARHRYVYAVALHDTGDTQGALSELAAVLQRSPGDRDSLAALVAFHREAGEVDQALAYARQLESLESRDVAVWR